MKKITAVCIVFISCLQLSGQNLSDTIEVKKMLGTVYLQKGKRLTPRELLNITQSNPQAYREMEIAKSNYDIASVIAFIGGGLVGWPVGTAIAGGKPNWTLAWIGGGLIVLTIPISSTSTKHANNAVRIYNEGLRHTGMNKRKIKFRFICSVTGIIITF